MVFVIHWYESAMDLQVFPIPIPHPTSLSTRFLWVFPVHQALCFKNIFGIDFYLFILFLLICLVSVFLKLILNYLWEALNFNLIDYIFCHLSLFSPSETRFSSVQFSCSVVSDSLQPHRPQHTSPLLFNMLSRLVITFFQGASIFKFHVCSHHLQWFWSPPAQPKK